MKFLQNNLFFGIVGRTEAEELLKNTDKNELKNVLLISIINPLPITEILSDLKEKAKLDQNKVKVPVTERGIVIEKELTKEELIEYIKKIEQKIQEKRESNLLEDINSFPIDKSLTKKVKDHITVSFWDIEEEIGGYKPISDTEAKKIANFILQYRQDLLGQSRLLIHCSAGISRSAGVGLAAKCIVFNDGDKKEFAKDICHIFGCNRYDPNLTVFNKIIEQFNRIKNG